SRSPGCSIARARRQNEGRSATRWARGSPLQLEDALTDAHGRPDRKDERFDEALRADERAVRRPEILDDPLVALGEDPCVARGGVVVVEDERARRRAADEDGRRPQRYRRTG